MVLTLINQNNILIYVKYVLTPPIALLFIIST